MPCHADGDLLYFLHVVPERQFEVIGGLGDAGETIVEEDVTAEIQVVRIPHPLQSLECSCTYSLPCPGALSTVWSCMAVLLTSALRLLQDTSALHVLCLQEFLCIFFVRDTAVHCELRIKSALGALRLQVEDAKDFIKNRILQLADKKQAPHKVPAMQLSLPVSLAFQTAAAMSCLLFTVLRLSTYGTYIWSGFAGGDREVQDRCQVCGGCHSGEGCQLEGSSGGEHVSFRCFLSICVCSAQLRR